MSWCDYVGLKWMGLGMAIHLSLAWLKSLGNKCQPLAIKILEFMQKDTS
jgi:hypothetical protein